MCFWSHVGSMTSILKRSCEVALWNVLFLFIHTSGFVLAVIPPPALGPYRFAAPCLRTLASAFLISDFSSSRTFSRISSVALSSHVIPIVSCHPLVLMSSSRPLVALSHDAHPSFQTVVRPIVLSSCRPVVVLVAFLPSSLSLSLSSSSSV